MLHFALHEWIPASWNPFVAPHTKKTKVLQIRQHNMSTYVMCRLWYPCLACHMHMFKQLSSRYLQLCEHNAL